MNRRSEWRKGVVHGRERITAFVQRHEVAWELGMGALAIAFVAVGVLGDQAAEPQGGRLALIDQALTAVFVAEFTIRFWAAPVRSRYVASHWIDLLALIPTVRGVRVLRLVRLLRLVRTFAGLFRALSSVERLAEHRGLALLFVVWLAVMVVCSAGLYLAEYGVNDAIQSPEDALWWGVVTLTTVGYGDIFPITTEGRIAAGVLMVLGITLFAGITATITSFLLSTGGGTKGPPDISPPSDLERQVRRLIVLRDDGIIDQATFEAGVLRVGDKIAERREAGEYEETSQSGSGRQQ